MGRRPTCDTSSRCVSERKIAALQRPEEVQLEASKLISDLRRALSHASLVANAEQAGDRIHRISTKKVCFANLEFRNYNVIIGDHPCCTMGCPLSLGWEYHEGMTTTVEHYEATRSPRRSRSALRTSCEERREILSRDCDLTEQEMRRAQRKLHRARSCNAKLCEKMTDAFFNDKCQIKCSE